MIKNIQRCGVELKRYVLAEFYVFERRKIADAGEGILLDIARHVAERRAEHRLGGTAIQDVTNVILVTATGVLLAPFILSEFTLNRLLPNAGLQTGSEPVIAKKMQASEPNAPTDVTGALLFPKNGLAIGPGKIKKSRS